MKNRGLMNQKSPKSILVYFDFSFREQIYITSAFLEVQRVDFNAEKSYFLFNEGGW